MLVLHGGFWRAGFTRRNTVALAVALADEGVRKRRVSAARSRGTARSSTTCARARESGRSSGSWPSAIRRERSWRSGSPRSVPSTRRSRSAASVTRCGCRRRARRQCRGRVPRRFAGGGSGCVPRGRPSRTRPARPRQVIVHGVDDDRVPVDHARRYVELASAAGDDLSPRRGLGPLRADRSPLDRVARRARRRRLARVGSGGGHGIRDDGRRDPLRPDDPEQRENPFDVLALARRGSPSFTRRRLTYGSSRGTTTSSPCSRTTTFSSTGALKSSSASR